MTAHQRSTVGDPVTSARVTCHGREYIVSFNGEGAPVGVRTRVNAFGHQSGHWRRIWSVWMGREPTFAAAEAIEAAASVPRGEP